MIGLPEILVLAVLVFVFFGYRMLPQLGRRAGSGLRTLGRGAQSKAEGIGRSARDAVSDRVDPAALGKQAGRGLREARELRDAVSLKEPEGSTSGDRPSDGEQAG